MDNIFEYKDWLDNHSKEDGSYRYYEQKYNARKKLLSVFWTPFFEEIKWNTKSIQKILKDYWYENTDLALKSLIVDWIKFFLNLNYEISVKDNILFDDYFLWLFDSLKINTKNKKLLNDILTELESWWESLPKSPRNILVTHQFNKKDGNKDKDEGVKTESEFKQPDNNVLELAQKIKPNYLQPIINAFWNKKEAFIQNLRAVWVAEERLEYVFLTWLLVDITKILNGEDIGRHQIVFERYNIDIDNKNRLASLKEAIEHHLSKIDNETSKKSSPKAETDQIKEKQAQYKQQEEASRYKKGKASYDRLYRDFNNRLNWKEVVHWHCAFNDWPEWLNMFGESLIKYEIWDEYIPITNCCAQETRAVLDVNLPCFDIVKQYDSWDRFIVEKPTYCGYFQYDKEFIKCWIVDIRSQKTWKVYRALSN